MTSQNSGDIDLGLEDLETPENLNELVPPGYRKKLNEQPVKIRNKAVYDHEGRIIEPYIYVVGLGEKHFKAFDREVQRIIEQFPWLKKKHIRFIINELVINTQFSMLRQVVQQVNRGKKAAGYFNVIIFACDDFFSTAIEEFGDFFDYYGYLESLDSIDYANPAKYDTVNETVLTKDDLLSQDHVKLVLDYDNNIRLADSSNRIGLNVIEKATDQDFYITSFYNKGQYMWKRIYFRIENESRSGKD